MLRLRQVIKPWKESAALNSHINLYGFWNQTAFLTKSGDLGMVLQVGGVDYESLDHAEQEYAVKRLEAALKAFGPGFHVYGACRRHAQSHATTPPPSIGSRHQPSAREIVSTAFLHS